MFFRPGASFSPPTIRQCFFYALPALLVGLVLRISYLAAIPEALVTADTASYLVTGYDLWEEGEFTMKDKRRWWYPLIVAALPLLPGSVAQSVAAIQHAAGLGAVLAIGWIVGQLTRYWRLWIPVTTALIAIWPSFLIFEHTFLAESLFIAAFIFTVALALPIQRLKEPARLLIFLSALTLTVGLRPPGRAVWLGAVILLICVARKRNAWRWQNIVAAVFCTVTAFTTGSDQMGSRLLLSSVLPLVDTEKPVYFEYRQALKPLILHAREYGSEYPWHQFYYKTRLDLEEETRVGDAWKQLAKNDREFGRVCKALAFETVLHHPLTFARFTLIKVMAASATPVSAQAGSTSQWEFDPPRFAEEQIKENKPRWKKLGERLQWIYGGLDQAGWEKLAQERAPRSLWFSGWISGMETWFPWMRMQPSGGAVPVLTLAWFGWLTLAGLAACLRPRLFLPSLMLWGPMLIYLGLTFGVGDRVPRFAVPVHWCWICLAVVALDTIALILRSILTKGPLWRNPDAIPLPERFR